VIDPSHSPVGATALFNKRNNVDFPLPDAPHNTVKLPSGKEKDTFSRAL
jgi:hypothetical protein